ncbi:hypothetical protein CXF85_01965 [Colwellia sp. 75C3]|uniref:DUF4365 domain-containing protein n=1 Tax=Colwellia sp. 75C3 TaxID=888425 RepID=UPI000C34B3A7|nr:DUF4365 domain-containing protein [Colwellia sp. 75C3]PKG86493.1 hypothetical protein CXF85_01965 [Colwellia sp. 75C3]
MKYPSSSNSERIGIYTVGAQFERIGCIFREQAIVDCGIDAQIEAVEDENASGKLIALQIKSGASYFKEEKDDAFIYRGKLEHLSYWLEHSLSVLIILCDIDNEVCYWQTVIPQNVKYTQKQWKIIVPKAQRINSGMVTDLKRLVNKMPSYDNYTISSTSDKSIRGAKRYSASIILNKEHTQLEIIHVIKKVTPEIANCEYHRSNITKTLWRDQPAQIVWLYVYPSAEDERNCNHICQTEWFSEALDNDYLPYSNNGENIGSNVRIVWNDSYLAVSKFNSENTMTKGGFIETITKFSNQSLPLFDFSEKTLKNYDDKKIGFNELYDNFKDKFDEVNDIYLKGTELGLSPFECEELSNQYCGLMSCLHSIFIFFSGIGEKRGESNIIWNVRHFIDDYKQAKLKFEIEFKKVA